jgi:predicted molibdopterin-dependent oxidoreductase YjgC
MTTLTDGKKQKDIYNPFDNTADSGGCGCGCSTASTRDASGAGVDRAATSMQMSVTIDGQMIEIAPGDKNIVDVASRAKIAIPAACYRAQRSKGCCHGCVVEIDGEQKFACATPTENGMNIVVDREDLKAIRKQNLSAYKEGIESGNPCKCSVSGSGGC